MFDHFENANVIDVAVSCGTKKAFRNIDHLFFRCERETGVPLSVGPCDNM